MTPTAVTFQLLLAFMVVNYADKAAVVGASLVDLDVRDWPADQLLVGDVGRVTSGELDVEVSAVIGNLTSPAAITRAHGIPFHHVPFTPGANDAAFAEVREIVDRTDPHAVVLARFMQVLPSDLCRDWPGARSTSTTASSRRSSARSPTGRPTCAA